MKQLSVLLVCAAMMAPSVQAWTVRSDFEEGTVGEIATGGDGLTSNAGQATISDVRAQSGKQSLKAEVQEGKTAYGGRIDFPSKLTEGDEIWFRAYWYYPTNWIFDTDAVGLKTMRIKVQESGGGNVGYHSIYIADSNRTVRPHSEIRTAEFNDVVYQKSSNGTYGQFVPQNEWHCFEIYVKLHSESGKGVYRIWQNGTLVFEDASVPTLGSQTDNSPFVLIGNYFNGTGPQTQSAYVDNIVVTNEVPVNRDIHGNPMIGMSEMQGDKAAPPNPPGAISIE